MVFRGDGRWEERRPNRYRPANSLNHDDPNPEFFDLLKKYELLPRQLETGSASGLAADSSPVHAGVCSEDHHYGIMTTLIETRQFF